MQGPKEAAPGAKPRPLCPECGSRLKEVYAEASYGRVIVLDQCERCGGVWFDKWELMFVADEGIKALEAVDTESFLAESPSHEGKGLCPRCSEPLAVFADANLPKDALIERCHGCSGIWLNRGELARYASHRSSRRGARKAPAAAGVETLRHLQKDLKLERVGESTAARLAASLDEEAQRPVNTTEVAKDLGFLALQALMRLVFKI